MRALLEKLDNPQNSFKVIHIAGTSGKGSTAYLIAKLLKEHGYRVGLHLSPHLQSVRERMIVNGVLISEEDFTKALNTISNAVASISHEFESPVTYFECLVALTFHYFKTQKIEYGVIETGLGGTYDGTNVVNSLITVITKIGFDHTAILGNTISEIAGQKAGIIKSQNTACISQRQLPDAEKIILERTKNQKVVLFTEGKEYTVVSEKISKNGSVFSYQDDTHRIDHISLPLLGEHQVENAGAAIKVLFALEKENIRGDADKIKKALSTAHFPGRMEQITACGQQWIVDGAHNEDKLKAFLTSLKKIFPQDKAAIIGFKKDKDISTCLNLLIPHFNVIVCTQSHALTDMGINMAVAPTDLEAKLRSLGYTGEIIVSERVEDAVTYVQEHVSSRSIAVVTGSLYLVGELRTKLGLEFSL
jgi:dihydrofolate synthase/folylpolyglutamate synthase